MGVNFCHGCGAAVDRRVPGARFCTRCGTALAGTAPAGPPPGGPSPAAAAPADRIAPAPAAGPSLPFLFRGSAAEYFGIWIVNVFLSVLTLGIYSAWAKVRRQRYFLGNTWLDGHNFEYHARPVAILKGRIAVFAIVIVYNLLLQLSPAFGVLGLGYLAALPWLVNASLSFNARMTSHRNVRFGFSGDYGTAFATYVLMPFAVALSLGVLLPVFSRMATRYVGDNLRYGTARFRTETPLGPLYGSFGLGILVLVGVWMVVGGLGAAISAAAGGSEGGIVAAGAGFYVGLAVFALFYGAGVRNAMLNAMILGAGHRLVSRVGRLAMVWIGVTNFLAILASLGLLRPWAAVRRWRYLAAATALMPAGLLDDFVADQAAAGNVAASEFADIEAIDFGF